MNDNTLQNARLVIVSNRLPVILTSEEGSLKVHPSLGGLVTALAPVLKNRGGLWIGWPGPVEDDQDAVQALLEKENRKTGFKLRPVFLTQEEVKLYYEGFSNEILWPLFHDLLSCCHFAPEYWKCYQLVSRKFADRIIADIQQKDFLWIHDYHLLLLGQELRKIKIQNKLAFFLHIPFPPFDIFIKLPWRFQILRALLEYDLIGFQTLRDLHNFIQCVRRLLKDVQTKSDKQSHLCITKDREIRAGAFPISIDFTSFSHMSSGQAVEDRALEKYLNFRGKKVVFSCDRLDISKGITDRLEAIRLLLKIYPDIHEKVIFFQVVVPSRMELPSYQSLKNEIDRLVGEINSQFTKSGWIPIEYVFRSITREELIAFYKISEIALITPIKDGMNLVAKEYIASNVDENGVLILSEFAGAATQLQREAFLINPYDIEGLAQTIHIALTLPPKERKKRMRKMRRSVKKYDVFWWLQSFLNAAICKELHDFPVIEEYTPTE